MYVLYIYLMASSLSSLDDAVVGLRVATQRPTYRQRLLAGIDFDGGVASLRLLRSVERLTDRERGPSIRQVATDLGVEHSTASRSVDSLVRADLVGRRRCADDQRQARLALTEQGRAVLAEATARRQEILASLVEDWTEADIETLAQLLDRLRAAFDEEFGRR